jgi:hypothetical protein
MRRTTPELAARVQWLFKRPAEELYDLETDPHEMKNLADDPQLRVRSRQGLRRQFDEWMTQQGDRGLETELIAQAAKARTAKRNRIRMPRASRPPRKQRGRPLHERSTVKYFFRVGDLA